MTTGQAATKSRVTAAIAKGKTVFWPANSRRRRVTMAHSLILALALAGPVAAAAAEYPFPEEQHLPVTPQQMQSGSLLLKMKSGYSVATRIDTNIDIEVSGPVARTIVRQTFQNDGPKWVESVYVFPLPDRAAVNRMRIRIGERIIEGEIRATEQAKKEYEAAKKAGQRAGLVEQRRANLFTAYVANLAPGATLSVEIQYLETLQFDDGVFSLRIPLTLTPRYIPGAPVPGRQGSGWAADTSAVPDASLITPPMVAKSSHHKVTLHAEIDAGVPLEYIVSRYHPITVTSTRSSGGGYRVDLKGSRTPMDHDVELVWKPVADAKPRAALFSETLDGQAHYLLMMLPPTAGFEEAARTPRELVFVIDTSGSMFGTSMEQARKAVLLALDGLRPTDRFNVVQFNSVTHRLFAASVPASAEHLDQARDYVDGLTANGGTEMRPALLLALQGNVSETHLKQIIFITDGSVGNENELYSLIEGRLGHARLFTVGIGSAPNSWFMRKAAEAGRGSYTFISALHEVNEKMSRLFQKLEQPQITGLRVEWPRPAAVAYPVVVPDLYAGEPIVVKARLSAPARDGDQVVISGNSPSGSWGVELPLRATRQNTGIAAVWARARIEDLLDQERRGGDAERIHAKVIDTALGYHLVSKYTSLVAVDKSPSRPETAALRKEQVPNLLPYGQSQRAIFGFPATATAWQAQTASGIVLILLASLLWAFCSALRNGLRSDAVAPG